MSMYAVDGDILNGIAHAIQSKTGSDEPMTVASMASAIEGISGRIPGFSKVDSGTIRFDDVSSVANYRIQHNLGEKAKVFVLVSGYNDTNYPNIPNALIAAHFVDLFQTGTYRTTTSYIYYTNDTATYMTYSSNSTYVGFIGTYTDYIVLGAYQDILVFAPDTDYNWIAFA